MIDYSYIIIPLAGFLAGYLVGCLTKWIESILRRKTKPCNECNEEMILIKWRQNKQKCAIWICDNNHTEWVKKPIEEE